MEEIQLMREGVILFKLRLYTVRFKLISRVEQFGLLDLIGLLNVIFFFF